MSHIILFKSIIITIYFVPCKIIQFDPPTNFPSDKLRFRYIRVNWPINMICQCVMTYRNNKAICLLNEKLFTWLFKLVTQPSTQNSQRNISTALSACL